MHSLFHFVVLEWKCLVTNLLCPYSIFFVTPVHSLILAKDSKNFFFFFFGPYFIFFVNLNFSIDQNMLLTSVLIKTDFDLKPQFSCFPYEFTFYDFQRFRKTLLHFFHSNHKKSYNH
jgi:hypothetical protein